MQTLCQAWWHQKPEQPMDGASGGRTGQVWVIESHSQHSTSVKGAVLWCAGVTTALWKKGANGNSGNREKNTEMQNIWLLVSVFSKINPKVCLKIIWQKQEKVQLHWNDFSQPLLWMKVTQPLLRMRK